MRGTGTLTLLFTDLARSTELFEHAGEERADELRRAYFNLLRESISAGGGQEVKSTGDGVMVAFEGAVDAIACAAAMQRSVERHNEGKSEERFSVRIGLNVGDPVFADGDYFGPTVVIAARLCESARGGQILISDLLRRLVDTAGGFQFRDVGPLELKGIAEPVTACEVLWESVAEEPLPLPASLQATERTPFVGRTGDLAKLHDLLDGARRGERRFVTLAGEPGIGKTRLVKEFALAAHEAGATVMLGHSAEGAVIPYQPFAEVLRHYVTTCPLTRLRTQVRAAGADVGTLVPELAKRVTLPPEPPGADPEGKRYRLFEAVSSLLSEASRTIPAVLILDDLHWADQPTMLLLRHLFESQRSAQLLVVGTYRPTEVPEASPLPALVSDLGQTGVATSMELGGLSEEDVASLIHASSGQAVPPALSRALHEETEGNPFFVGEMLRHLSESGALPVGEPAPVSFSVEEIGIPEGVKDVIGRRFSKLSPPVSRTLTIASVIGRSFQLDVLERVSGRSADELAEWLEDAVLAQVVQELPGTIGHYAFAHTLIRETFHDGLTATRRVHLHRRIGEVIEELYEEPEPHLPLLAYHFLKAVPVGSLDKAIDYSIAAGQQALRQLAYEQAPAHFERALAALGESGGTDEELRREVLVQLEEANVMAGNRERAKSAVIQVAAIARRQEAAEALARGALTYARPYPEAGVSDEFTLNLLEEALEMLGREDRSLRARALGRLAMELHWTNKVEHRFALSQEAIEVARRVGDPTALGAALHCRHYAIAGPDTVQERLALAREMLQIAAETGNPELALWAHHHNVYDSLELGDVDAVEGGIREQTRLARELRYPFYIWVSTFLRSMWALVQGRLEDAERLATEAVGAARGAEAGEAVHNFAVQIYNVRREQGRLAELEPTVRQVLAERAGGIPGWRAGLAYVYAELEQEPGAREIFEGFAEDEFRVIPRDITWIMTMNLLADVCAFLGDVRRAGLLYDMLAPYGHLNAVVGTALACTGSVSRSLGRLATMMERWDAAEQHFRDALAMNTNLRSPTWVAYTKRDYAALLLATRDPAKREKAIRLLDESLETARQVGMHNLEGKIGTLKESMASVALPR